jgi:quinol monooxygenase YgiN
MVRLSITLNAASARDADSLVEGLQFLVPSTRLEPGCIGCSAWSDPDSTVRYLEDWATEADLRRRVLSDPFTTLLAVVEFAQHAQVQFDFVTQTRGLDYVVEVREQKI